MLLNPFPGSEDKFMGVLLDETVGMKDALTELQLISLL
jgi:hypothetical protein